MKRGEHPRDFAMDEAELALFCLFDTGNFATISDLYNQRRSEFDFRKCEFDDVLGCYTLLGQDVFYFGNEEHKITRISKDFCPTSPPPSKKPRNSPPSLYSSANSHHTTSLWGIARVKVNEEYHTSWTNILESVDGGSYFDILRHDNIVRNWQKGADCLDYCVINYPVMKYPFKNPLQKWL